MFLLQERLIKLQSEIASGEGARRLAELTSIHEEATARLRRAKAVVAAKTREIGKLERLIDEVPSQAELLQYERRFMELFDLVSSMCTTKSLLMTPVHHAYAYR